MIRTSYMIKTSGQLAVSDYKLFKIEEKNLKKLGKNMRYFSNFAYVVSVKNI